MKGVQCYELFRGIALKSHAFYGFVKRMQYFYFVVCLKLDLLRYLDGILVHVNCC